MCLQQGLNCNNCLNLETSSFVLSHVSPGPFLSDSEWPLFQFFFLLTKRFRLATTIYLTT